MSDLKSLRFLMVVVVVLASFGNYACSVYMEETRPEPTRLDQFQPGENRDEVLEKLGSPVTSADYNAMSCDLYQLYVGGYGQGGKVPIALVETAADVFTLGLAEVISTPTEEATRNRKTPVWFCYQKGALSKVIPGHLPVETAATSGAASTPGTSEKTVAPSVQAASVSVTPATSVPTTHTAAPIASPAASSSETE
jgi:hypothetical protein